MEIDLGILGEFVNSRKFWGSMAIGLPILTIGLFILYSLVGKISFLKNIVQYIILTYGFSIILMIPLVFFSAFLDAEPLKLALSYLIILFCISIYILFNQREVVKFIKELPTQKKS